MNLRKKQFKKYISIDKYKKNKGSIVCNNIYFSSNMFLKLINQLMNFEKDQQFNQNVNDLELNFSSTFENNYKKLFEYIKKYDIMLIEHGGLKYNNFNFQLKNYYNLLIHKRIITKTKILFNITYLSIEILKSLEKIYNFFPKQLLEELHFAVEVICSSLKQIIIMVRFDIRGLVDCRNKRHFEYAFDELSLQLHCLSFNSCNP